MASAGCLRSTSRTGGVCPKTVDDLFVVARKAAALGDTENVRRQAPNMAGEGQIGLDHAPAAIKPETLAEVVRMTMRDARQLFPKVNMTDAESARLRRGGDMRGIGDWAFVANLRRAGKGQGMA